MRRRRRTHPPLSHERWLVSYADFITLLFAFFTTMYAISTVDAQKLSKMVNSMQLALSGVDARPVRPPRAAPSDKPLPVAEDPRASLVELQGQLAARLKRQLETGNVSLDVDPRGLVVSIREAGSFASGSAELSEPARALLVEVGATLAELDHPIRVEGHTDDTPIRTSQYRSNWELSTARATSVITFLVATAGLEPRRLSAAGYGEFHPRTANDSAANRGLNRRVDLVVLNAASRAEEPSAAKAGPAPPRAEPRP
jgi:chemotaxis protein MotB